MEPVRLLPELWLFKDTCNVYVLKEGNQALAVDFGSGKWLPDLPALGVKQLTDVFLTHSHPDQCAGLLKKKAWPFAVHAAAGSEEYLEPEQVRKFQAGSHPGEEYLQNYFRLSQGIPGVVYDMAGFTDIFWNRRRIRFLLTPGHTPFACSMIVDACGKQVVFCGDAAYAGAKIWQPFNLEWDHWTGTGILAAWEGIQRLKDAGINLLCPGHGPVVEKEPREMLKTLARRLLKFYEAKGSICPGEPDRYVEPETISPGWYRISRHLYQFGSNGYLLLSEKGEGLIVDPWSGDMEILERLLGEPGNIRPTAALVTHYHYDHCDGIPYLRKKYRTKAWLHPWIAEILKSPARYDLPFVPDRPIAADGTWPEKGNWKWNEYRFRVAPWPGQTWRHCVFMAEIDGRKVLFGGDSFQPASRWGGTGGFCAYNNSRFQEGFVRSAKLVLEWKPDIIATGHQTCYRYHPAKFRKIISWAHKAEQATRTLCPTGDLEKDYYAVHSLRQKKT